MSFRLFRSSPGVALSAIVALAMGIGFTATMFAIVRGAARPLPVDEPDEIVALQKVGLRRGAASTNTRYRDLMLWESAAAFESLAAFEPSIYNLSGDGQAPERIEGVTITANVFDVLGVLPARGRGFDSEDDRADRAAVVLSDVLWRSRFGGDPAVVGRDIRLNGGAHTVIGVMPPGMGFPINARIWTLFDPARATEGDGPIVTAFGRLAEGATLDRAAAELSALTSAAALESPATYGGIGVQVLPFTEIETPREVIRGLQVLVLAVSMVLLIACANVASLLVVRGAARSREIATRIAIGASRRQLIADQLAESVALSAFAAVLGLGFAHLAVRAFAAATADTLQAYWVEFSIDTGVVAFASLLAGISTVAAGLGPALRISSTNAIDVLRDRSHGSTGISLGRVARRLPAAQIAMACGLLALTVAFSRAAVELRARPWPFDPSTILSAQIGLTPESMSDQTRRNRMIAALSEQLSHQTGIESAGLTSLLPGTGGNWTFALDSPAATNDGALQNTALAMVTPAFFDVVGARVLAGRGLTPQDDAAAPAVAVANQSFVERFSAEANPIGRRIFLGQREITIVGVVSDAMARDIQDRRNDGLYIPMLQARPHAVRVVARGPDGGPAQASAIRDAVAEVDPDLPLFEIATLRDAVFRDKAVLDIFSTLFLCFGAGALALTAIGLYSVVALSLAQRTREFGVRMALGASRVDIARLVARQGGWQIAVGVTAGVAVAVVLTRVFAAAMENAPRADGEVFAVIGIAMTLTAGAAMLVPARRAMSLGIVEALKRD